MLGLSTNSQLESSRSSGYQDQDNSEYLQKRSKCVASLLLAISIGMITLGIRLVHQRCAWGPLLLLISAIPFYAAWGLLLTKAGF